MPGSSRCARPDSLSRAAGLSARPPSRDSVARPCVMPSLREPPGAPCDIPLPEWPAEPADIPFSLAAPPPPGPCADARLTPASNAAVVTRNLLFLLFVIYFSSWVLLSCSLALQSKRTKRRRASKTREAIRGKPGGDAIVPSVTRSLMFASRCGIAMRNCRIVGAACVARSWARQPEFQCYAATIAFGIKRQPTKGRHKHAAGSGDSSLLTSNGDANDDDERYHADKRRRSTRMPAERHDGSDSRNRPANIRYSRSFDIRPTDKHRSRRHSRPARSRHSSDRRSHNPAHRHMRWRPSHR